MLSLTVKGYVEALGKYRRALRHRCRATADEMSAWERVLAGAGAKVVAARRGWADAWRERYVELCEAIGETDRASGPTGLRLYGSAGQHRTAALGLRLCEAETLRAPTICLDDAFAELDVARKLSALIEAMAAGGTQVIAAVPKEGEVPGAIASLPRWAIADGTIHA